VSRKRSNPASVWVDPLPDDGDDPPDTAEPGPGAQPAPTNDASRAQDQAIT